MSIYEWNFEIKNFPDAPTGYNKAAPPPPPELVETTEIKVVDVNDPAFGPWLTALFIKEGPRQMPQYMTMVIQAIGNGIFNAGVAPWPTLIKAAGTDPPLNSVKLFAKAQWKQIFQLNNQGRGGAKHEVSTKEGVTTSDSETKTFGAKVGISVTAGFGPVSATMSAEFSASQSNTHSIAFTQEKTVSNTFEVPADTYTQVWQLSMFIQAGDNGPILEQATQAYQQLSYPPVAETAVSEAEAQAQVEAMLSTLDEEALAI